MNAQADDATLRSIFLDARTANGFLDRPVPREAVMRAVELALLGPTSANSLPMRMIVVQSPEAKEKLRPALSPSNVDKTIAAPMTAIVAADQHFYENFTRTFPHRGDAMKANFSGADNVAKASAFAWDNALLQMGYFILSLRAVGLDAGPMGGFEREKVNASFFPDGKLKAIFLINIGYADPAKLMGPRLPRLTPDEVVRFE
ncbi:MAG TPA: malonic semialdehyde reductase [Candidatus Acidoferrales bacterium]|nr:malonic semialdehyde reductase [Candidatus Acidoferrales bacterium]